MSNGNRCLYDTGFKRNANALANEPGRSAHSVEQSLGISQGLIGRYRKRMKKDEELAFPGNGVKAWTPDQKRIRELEKKLADLEMD